MPMVINGKDSSLMEVDLGWRAFLKPHNEQFFNDDFYEKATAVYNPIDDLL